MVRFKFAALSVLLTSLAVLSVTAQEKSTKDGPKKADEPAVVIVKSQLPRNWKSLGLTDAQRKTILTTRAKYQAKRLALEERIKELKTEEQDALLKILTESQRSRLKEKK